MMVRDVKRNMAGAMMIGLIGVMGAVDSASADMIVAPFDEAHWNLASAQVVEHLGRTALVGSAMLKDVQFGDGVVEVDIAIERQRGYPGFAFHVGGPGASESVYIRPHRAGLYADAVQYTPVFNGVSSWQLYAGPGYTSGAEIPTGAWVRMRLEVSGVQARVYIGEGEAPALVINDLKHGAILGGLGLSGAASPGSYFSNFRYDPDAELSFDPPPTLEPTLGMLCEWEVSPAYALNRIDMERTPDQQGLGDVQWMNVTADPSGLVDIARQAARTSQAGDCVFARTAIHRDEAQTLALNLGYSDAVSVFINGQLHFTGNSAYRSRDGSFLGIIGLHDTTYLPLKAGSNELILAVAETFGGWGFMAQDARYEYVADRLTELWEIDHTLSMPESVVYDAKRDALYVSNFFNDGREFISKLTLEGEIEVLHWVTGLNRPTGLCLYGDRLWAVDRLGVCEIDIDAGEIVERYALPGAGFPNDITFDADGFAYVTDSGSSAIYRLADGVFSVWRAENDTQFPNSIYYDGDMLLVGVGADGALKAIDPGKSNEEAKTITALGPGVTVDGVQRDGNGGWIMSDFAGRVFHVDADGVRVELLNRTVTKGFCADLCYIPHKRLLIIPSLYDNRLTAYRVGEE